jgi:glutamyl/glutaminyl-tRNA synthetase
MTDSVRSRIAPTPSGYLHIGNAYNFLLTEAIVQSKKGILRLRVDDLDALRVRPEYLDDVFESLSWLGIHTDEGPRGAIEQDMQYSQMLRLPEYDVLLRQLVASDLVFACNCSRKDLQQNNQDGQYPGTCLHKGLSLDTPDIAWRIRTTDGKSRVAFEDRILGPLQINIWDTQRYFIVRRRDGLPAYYVASLCDDVAFGINTIVRGEDLITSTAAQLHLSDILGLTSFTNTSFYHHPLLQDERGQKLSKSAGSTSLKALRLSGISSEEIRLKASAWYEPFLS